MKKGILLSVGFLSLALGIIGIFLPLLPTTPFLLLSAVCFSKASPRLHQALLNHRLTGPIISDWQTRRVIRPRAKITATIFLVPTLLTATIFSSWPTSVSVALLLLVAGVLTFLWSQKSH